MPLADPSFGWQEAMAAFAIVSVVAFLVTWVVTDRVHVSRTPYVAVLTLTTLALAAGYVVWSGTSVTDLVTLGWWWGILAGVIAGTVVAPGVRQMPSGRRAVRSQLVGRLLWEGAVYGIAEGAAPGDAARAGGLASHPSARLDGRRVGEDRLGRARDPRSVARDHGPPSRIPGVPGTRRHEEADRRPRGVRRASAGVPGHRDRSRPDRGAHHAPRAVDPSRGRDAAGIGHRGIDADPGSRPVAPSGDTRGAPHRVEVAHTERRPPRATVDPPP